MSTTPEDRPDGTPHEGEQVPAASRDQASGQQVPGSPATEPVAAQSPTPTEPPVQHPEQSATEALPQHAQQPATEPLAQQHPQESPTQRIAPPAPTQSFPQAPRSDAAPTQPLHAPLTGPAPTGSAPAGAAATSPTPTGPAATGFTPSAAAATGPAPTGATAPGSPAHDSWARPSDPRWAGHAPAQSAPAASSATTGGPTAAPGTAASGSASPERASSSSAGQTPEPRRVVAQPTDPFAVPGSPVPGQAIPGSAAAPGHPAPQPSARPTVSWGAPTPPPQQPTPVASTPEQPGPYAGPYGTATESDPANGGPEYPAAFGAPAPEDQQPPVEKKQRGRTLLPMVAVAVAAAVLASGGTAVLVTALDDGGSSGSANIATLGQSNAAGVPVSGSTVENPDWQAVASAVKNSVVAIQVVTNAGEAEGSGVIADADGNIITNNHVVSGAQDDQVQVTLSDGRIYTADVVGTDSTTDLAVIRLQDPPEDLSPAAMAEDSPTVGDPVMAVGNPLGLANTVTTGIVSALDRPVSTTETGSSETVVTNAIQIDAAVNPGNSGGPLFNAQGQVIGITSSIATTSSASGSIGLGFAIPISLAQMVAGQLVQDGVAEHAYLGVGLTNGTATADGVTRAGAQVQSVSGGSPASAAGLQNGDVIVAIDDKVVAGAESLTGYVRTHSSGDEVTLTVVRNGQSMSVDVTLAVREEEGTAGSGSGGSGQGGSGQGGQGQGGSGDGSDGSDGSGDGLENMTPEQLWEWFQQQQGGGQG
ncbi:trypsin-like peptidase domain-containing protein [Cellulomonas sp. NPDC089187]|uniref:trypsin-like peptidase domain-containing protein n=1 Tax=Cellulomonas sp. NPDC089187 TaxID=3154970 RepID=UPI0034258E1A